VTYKLSILTLVGIGLKENSFVIVYAITALKKNNISFKIFDMSSSKIFFYIGVSQNISNVALKTLQKELLGK
jgi:aspartate kinase